MKFSAPEFSFNLSRWAIEHHSFSQFIVVLLMLAGIVSYLNLGQK